MIDDEKTEKSEKSEKKADILVVDDNPANLGLLASMLQDEGYDVRAALSGTLALGALDGDDDLPDLVLCDVNMPGVNGFDVCLAMKANLRTRQIPVIFISALDAIGDKVAAFEVGGADYVTKPFQVREVLARVATQLTILRLRRELTRQREENAELLKRIAALVGRS